MRADLDTADWKSVFCVLSVRWFTECRRLHLPARETDGETLIINQDAERIGRGRVSCVLSAFEVAHMFFSWVLDIVGLFFDTLDELLRMPVSVFFLAFALICSVVGLLASLVRGNRRRGF